MVITPEVLSKFSSFRDLSENQQQDLLETDELQLLQSQPGEKIISRGSNDDYCFFLVSGSLKLIARDGYTTIIKADSESAMQPITQLKPRQYDVLAESNVSYLKVEAKVLNEFNPARKASKAGIQLENEASNADIYFKLYHDIKGDHVVVPSLSDIAHKINTKLKNEKNCSAQSLGDFLLADPAVTAKIIKLAIATKGLGPVSGLEDIVALINRLGLHKSVDVARLLSEKDIFRPANETQSIYAKELWHETVLISVIASVLAEEFEHLDPKIAQLVGLVHNVGAILILDCIGKDRSLGNDIQQIRAVIDELGSNITGMLLQKWGFAQHYLDAAKDAEFWKRTNESKPLDYCDLIIIAKLLVKVAKSKVEEAPVLTELAVFRKLNWGKNGVVQGLQVLTRARLKMKKLLQVFDKQ